MTDLSRQSFLGPEMENVLANTPIGLMGVNGGGSHWITQLAHVGFKKYVIADPDYVENSNLNRNVLASIESAQARRMKVDLAAEKILSLVPDAEIIRVYDKWQIGAEKGLFDSCKVLVSAVDSLSERDQIERFSRRLKIPHVDVGMDVKLLPSGNYAIYGQAIMTFPHGPCMRCLGFLTNDALTEEAGRYGDAGPRAQVVWPNGSLVSIAMGFVTKHFLNWSKANPDYWYRLYDGNLMTVTDNEVAAMLVAKMKNGCPHFE